MESLSVSETAERLGVSVGLVYTLCAKKRIRGERHGLGRGTIKIPEDALEEYGRAVTESSAEGRFCRSSAEAQAQAPLARLAAPRTWSARCPQWTYCRAIVAVSATLGVLALRLAQGPLTFGGTRPSRCSRARPIAWRTRLKRQLTAEPFRGPPSALRSSGPDG